jgi:hypothetical protein
VLPLAPWAPRAPAVGYKQGWCAWNVLRRLFVTDWGPERVWVWGKGKGKGKRTSCNRHTARWPVAAARLFVRRCYDPPGCGLRVGSWHSSPPPPPPPRPRRPPRAPRRWL